MKDANYSFSMEIVSLIMRYDTTHDITRCDELIKNKLLSPSLPPFYTVCVVDILLIGYKEYIVCTLLRLLRRGGGLDNT
jgi:hypothetical protein